MTRAVGTIVALSIAIVGAVSALAAGPPPPAGESIGRTPPRLSLADGEVSFWRAGAPEWEPARVNTALAPDDELYAGGGSNFELQIGARAYVRGGEGTSLSIVDQDDDFLRLRVNKGHISLDLRTVPTGRAVEVDTPQAALRIERPGYYRVEVSAGAGTFVVRRGGQATLVPVGRAAASIGPDERVIVEGDGSPRIETSAAPPLDDWDSWNYRRTDQLVDGDSARYVASDVYGLEPLDRHGSWRVVERYGPLWAPSRVEAGWVPYSAGRWTWEPYYGWTWVDDAPWGWAPFHYGRWVYVDDLWMWAPGPIVARPVYAPALVAFFGGGDVAVGVGIGTPFLSWVALGWGEPLVPWWGPRGFIGRPCWRGWHGPRVVNNVIVEHTTVVRVHDIRVYEHARRPRAVIAVPRDRFGRETVVRTRLPRVDIDRARPLHDRLPAPPENALRARRSPRDRFERRALDRHVAPDAAVSRRSRPPRSIPERAARRETAPVTERRRDESPMEKAYAGRNEARERRRPAERRIERVRPRSEFAIRGAERFEKPASPRRLEESRSGPVRSAPPRPAPRSRRSIEREVVVPLAPRERADVSIARAYRERPARVMPRMAAPSATDEVPRGHREEGPGIALRRSRSNAAPRGGPSRARIR